ncbi:SET domain-containing protein 9 [Entophlyctis sp. JEL0112]|nr:SET domain-containing protein 9 [Entophlyctis sp. JEL0112]
MSSFWARLAVAQRLRAHFAAALSPAASSDPACSCSCSSNRLSSRDIVSAIVRHCSLPAPAFRLHVLPSRIPHAGLGLFLTPLNSVRSIPRGSVVALYPGIVYSPSDPVFLPSISNHYILQTIDGSLIDGKHNGLSRSMYRSLWRRERVWKGIEYDISWLDQRRIGSVQNWNVGQLINNSGAPENANVIYNEYTLDETFPFELRKFIPNIPYSPEETSVNGIALVTTADLEFENETDQVELLAAYQSLV